PDRYPELRNNAPQLIDLLVGEYTFRRRREPLDPEEFVARFPDLGETLRQRLKALPPDPEAQLPIPAQVGRYRLERWLGCGAMRTVYLARDSVLDRPVAIKFHNPGAGHPSLGDRFRLEAVAAARVQHPGVCPIFDSGQITGLSYLVLAYIEAARPLTV